MCHETQATQHIKTTEPVPADVRTGAAAGSEVRAGQEEGVAEPLLPHDKLKRKTVSFS